MPNIQLKQAWKRETLTFTKKTSVKTHKMKSSQELGELHAPIFRASPVHADHLSQRVPSSVSNGNCQVVISQGHGHEQDEFGWKWTCWTIISGIFSSKTQMWRKLECLTTNLHVSCMSLLETEPGDTRRDTELGCNSCICQHYPCFETVFMNHDFEPLQGIQQNWSDWTATGRTVSPALLLFPRLFFGNHTSPNSRLLPVVRQSDVHVLNN